MEKVWYLLFDCRAFSGSHRSHQQALRSLHHKNSNYDYNTGSIEMSPNPMITPIKIFVISPQRLLVEALCLLINRDPACTVTGQACCAQEALDLTKTNSPDIFLLDLDLPEGINIHLIEALKFARANAPLLGLTLCTRPDAIRLLLQLDLQACLSKDITGAELFCTLKLLKDGGGKKSCHHRLFTHYPYPLPAA
jgi:CheY-like chemotaxis protein